MSIVRGTLLGVGLPTAVTEAPDEHFEINGWIKPQSRQVMILRTRKAGGQAVLGLEIRYSQLLAEQGVVFWMRWSANNL